MLAKSIHQIANWVSKVQQISASEEWTSHQIPRNWVWKIIANNFGHLVPLSAPSIPFSLPSIIYNSSDIRKRGNVVPVCRHDKSKHFFLGNLEMDFQYVGKKYTSTPNRPNWVKNCWHFRPLRGHIHRHPYWHRGGGGGSTLNFG